MLHYELYTTYSNRDAAYSHIQAEDTWYKKRLRNTKEGMIETFQCKHLSCNRRYYMLFNSDSSDVSLCFNNQ